MRFLNVLLICVLILGCDREEFSKKLYQMSATQEVSDENKEVFKGNPEVPLWMNYSRQLRDEPTAEKDFYHNLSDEAFLTQYNEYKNYLKPLIRPANGKSWTVREQEYNEKHYLAINWVKLNVHQPADEIQRFGSRDSAFYHRVKMLHSINAEDGKDWDYQDEQHGPCNLCNPERIRRGIQ